MTRQERGGSTWFRMGKDIKIFAGNANKPFAESICRNIGKGLGDSKVTSFSDGEISVSLYESVRGSDVFIIQPTCAPINNHLMELSYYGGCLQTRVRRPHHSGYPVFRYTHGRTEKPRPETLYPRSSSQI